MRLDRQRHLQGPQWQEEILNVLGLSRWEEMPLTDRDTLATACPPPEATLTYYSSGSTGAPKPIHYTDAEWGDGVAHRAECLSTAGVRAGDRAAVVLPFGPWFSGDQLCDALLELGANVLPVGHYTPHLPGALRVMGQLEINVVITTPSLAYTLPHGGVTPRGLILLGERCPPPLREELTRRYGVAPRSIYAASETIIGPDTEKDPNLYSWDHDRLHLEVLREDGSVSETGRGELLVTRRHSVNRIYRYQLGDYVELSLSSVRFLGRLGHAFTLASGVKIQRRTLDAALDRLAAPISGARFVVHHHSDGDLIEIHLAGPTSIPPEALETALTESSMEIADALACGHARLQVRHTRLPQRGKRLIRIEELPWAL